MSNKTKDQSSTKPKDLRLKCRRCKEYTQTISPIKISKYNPKGIQITAICSICNRLKTKKLNCEQISLLPDEIKNSDVGSKFVDDGKAVSSGAENYTRDGGIIPIIPLIGAILAGVTALSSVAGTVASNVIQAKRNNAEIEIQSKAIGEGVTPDDVFLQSMNKLEGLGFRIYKV